MATLSICFNCEQRYTQAQSTGLCSRCFCPHGWIKQYGVSHAKDKKRLNIEPKRAAEHQAEYGCVVVG